MHEKRVRRGPAFGSRSRAKDEKSKTSTRVKMKRFVKKSQARVSGGHEDLESDPFPAAQIQTEKYLIEMDVSPEEVNGFTQTDEYLPPTPEPVYVTPKYGTDAVTQVDPNEVFDFDEEVEPILEVFVGKILQQSVCEVLRERELNKLESQKETFEAKKRLRIARVERMRQEELRLEKEKQLRLAEQREKAEILKREINENKVNQNAEAFLDEISETVFSNLISSGQIEDPLRREIRHNLIPWLKDQVEQELNLRKVSRAIVDQLIKDAIKRNRDASSIKVQ